MNQTNLASLLWMSGVAITVSVILFTQAGIGLGLEYSLVSGVSLLAWCRRTRSEPIPSSTVVYYLMTIVCLLGLSTVRYAAHFSTSMHAQHPTLFPAHLATTYSHWFLLQVCLPICLLLGGGYFLLKQTAIGRFFAVWGFLFGAVDALSQLAIDLTQLTQFAHLYFLGVFMAMGQFLVSSWGLLSLTKSTPNPITSQLVEPMTSRRINLWSGLFISFGIVYAITLYTQAGPLPVGVIIGSMMGGLIGWRKTTARHSADPHKIGPLYLLLQALFYAHVGEEVLTHFNRSIAALSNHPWSDTDFDYVITLLGPIVWVFAAYSLWKRQAFGNFILWFMIVGMILGEPTHLLVFPVVRMVKEGVPYRYFPGMYTALFPMIPAILALALILHEHQQAKQQPTTSYR